jgi:hypothetical protein
MTSAQLHPLVGQTDIVERIKGRLNDAPMPTERLLDECAAEIERLRERLEMTHAWQFIDGQETRIEVEPGSIPDGIECRDETIRLQDREIERLRTALRAVRACTDPAWAAQIVKDALREEQ